MAAGGAALPVSADTGQLLGLARALTQLSSAAWRTYTHPASTAGFPEPNSDVSAAIGDPNMPTDGTMIVSYSSILESAHRVGRALHDLGDPRRAKTIAAEAAAEVAAVESAELGDLAGCARQAILLSREDASPVQVAAADLLLEQDLFGPAELFIGIDPTAATVTAAHWLAAAADAAVTDLVRHAMQVADGLLPDPVAIREQLEEFEETLSLYSGRDEPDLTGFVLRLTALDPKRPALDLLEDLLTGIHGCSLLYSEYDDLDDGDEHDAGDDLEEWDDQQAEQQHHRSRERFAQLVRETAARHRDRLI